MYQYYKSDNDNSAKYEALFQRKSAVKDCRYVYWRLALRTIASRNCFIISFQCMVYCMSVFVFDGCHCVTNKYYIQ